MSAIFVEARTIAKAWEKAVVKTWEKGDEIKTDYDHPGDPPSKDTDALIVVKNPLAEPRIHKAFPGGLNDLLKYREEVVNGVHDHWVDPEHGKWSYTYHGRLVAYPLVRVFGPDGKEKDPENDVIDPKVDTFRVERVNQLEDILDDLQRAGHSRRAVAGIWRPSFDIKHKDPPCLDLVQFRVFGDNKLRMSILIRSNDNFKAAFMNMYAFTELQKDMARRLSERTGREIVPEEYHHHALSFHLYGSYFREFAGFMEQLTKRPDRYFRSDEPIVQGCFNDGRVELLREGVCGRDRDAPLAPIEHRRRLYAELPKDIKKEYAHLSPKAVFGTN